MAHGGVDEPVYPWQGEAVFGAHLVEVGDIDAHSLAPIMLLYEDYVGNPFRVGRLLGKIGLEESASSTWIAR